MLSAQSLRLREELETLLTGPLAVPAKKLAGQRFPFSNRLVFHEASAIRFKHVGILEQGDAIKYFRFSLGGRACRQN